MPYESIDDGVFSISEDYYGQGEYEKAIEREHERTRGVDLYESVYNSKKAAGGVFEGSDGKMYSVNQESGQGQGKVAYSACDGMLYDDTGEEDTVDRLISMFASQSRFVEMASFDGDTMEEDFESELSLWLREHSRIASRVDEFGDEWVLAHEPRRVIGVRFTNNAGEDVYAFLEDCMVMDVADGDSVILLVGRMTLTDKIR